MNRKVIFDAVRSMLGRSFTQAEVDGLDAAIDEALTSETPAPSPPPASRAARSLGEAGKALIRKREGCGKRRPDGTFAAYPDPGSADGHPWTIGWGSTGPPIGKGTVWTQAQCDARLDRDIAAFACDVAKAIGDAPTTQNQFDALVAFHYNTGRIASATLTKLHRQGRHAEAQAEFGKWIHNDGTAMQGLIKRRAEEARLYGTPDLNNPC